MVLIYKDNNRIIDYSIMHLGCNEEFHEKVKMKYGTEKLKIMVEKPVPKIVDNLLPILKEYNIIPDYEFSRFDTRYGMNFIYFEWYPTDLGDYIENNDITTVQELNDKLGFDIENQISSMIDKIHSLGILHGDLHAKNIVINPQTKDVRIIDFDDKYCKSIEYIKKKIAEFWDNDASNISDVLEYEKRIWKNTYLH